MPKHCSLPVSSAYRWTIFRAGPSPTPSIHNTEPITMDDVIIIGGSFAGPAAARRPPPHFHNKCLTPMAAVIVAGAGLPGPPAPRALAPPRRNVTVLDTGL